ncbi:MAG: DUF2249 domain-containing protein [Verrucomicrobiales bacterium]|nr:DUF2249 domain-containing protein [Verrucomicrobiales bacterium]
MPPVSQFRRLDVRPLIASGQEPMSRIRAVLASLRDGQGLMLIAPFLPSVLIEVLGSEGFQSRVEPGTGRDWIVYFWQTAG